MTDKKLDIERNYDQDAGAFTTGSAIVPLKPLDALEMTEIFSRIPNSSKDNLNGLISSSGFENYFINVDDYLDDTVKVDKDLWGKEKSPFNYKTLGSAGFDISARLKDSGTIIEPGELAIISTGLRIQMPEDVELQIRSRSGLAYKNQVVILNSPGTIDSDYRDEIKVLLMNHGKENFIVRNGDRIAQGVFSKVYRPGYVLVDQDKLNKTQREGGFGSTGVSE